jgi:hypothetical protein
MLRAWPDLFCEIGEVVRGATFCCVVSSEPISSGTVIG